MKVVGILPQRNERGMLLKMVYALFERLSVYRYGRIELNIFISEKEYLVKDWEHFNLHIYKKQVRSISLLIKVCVCVQTACEWPTDVCVGVGLCVGVCVGMHKDEVEVGWKLVSGILNESIIWQFLWSSCKIFYKYFSIRNWCLVQVTWCTTEPSVSSGRWHVILNYFTR